MPPRPLTLDAVGLFFELSLGLSARKEIPGSSWFLRMNPSSGNLHPTEAYAILPALKGLPGGAGFYRELFWEAGMIGQVLYLAAEAAGVRGTGIGCYLDDVFHSALGLAGHEWQSLCHFTIGGPVEDSRLRTVPPYAHLEAGGR